MPGRPVPITASLFDRHPFATCLAGLLAYGLAFPPIGLWPLAWVGLVPVFYTAGRGRLSLGRVFFLTFGAFSLLHLFLYHWIFNFLPVGMPFVVIVLSLYYAAAMTMLAALTRRRPRLRVALTLACFLFAEAGRSSGAVSLTWCLAGHSQADALPLLQSAALWGVWGLSGCLILTNALLAAWLVRRAAGERAGMEKRHAWYPWAALAIPCLLFLGGLVRLANPPETVDSGRTIALVQTGADPAAWETEYAVQAAELFRLAGEAAAAGPAIVVFPETALPCDAPGFCRDFQRRHGQAALAQADGPATSQALPVIAARAMRLALVHGTAFLLTANRYDEAGPGTNGYNSALLLEPGLPFGTWNQAYDKRRLVPFGESLPYPAILGFLRPLLQTAGLCVFAAGTNATVFRLGRTTFSIMICYEDWFENMAAEFRRGGAEGLLNVTSDARFSSRMAEAQHLAGSRFAAVTAGLPVYRAANSGITAAIDPQGRVKERLTRGRPGILTVPWRVAPTGRDTAFVRFGHHAKTLLGGLSLLVLCAALLPRRRGTDRP